MADKDKPDSQQSAPDEPPAKGRNVIRVLVIALISVAGPIAAIAFGLYVYLAGGRYAVTDNAYTKSEKVAVSPDISGRVIAVQVRENQVVAAGQALFSIDPKPFKIALAKADAELAGVRQEILAMQANFRQTEASLERARSDVKFFADQFARQQKLSSRRVVSQTVFDEAERRLRNARHDVGIVEQQLAETRAKLGGTSNVSVNQHPRVAAAKAARDQAALALSRAQVRTATNGVVTNFDLQVGEYVEPGKVVFSIVGADDIWVHAHYKETELENVRPGQPVKITVDAFPGSSRRGVVDSIAPATGAEFALLPPQNATGNWVKVVRRLTVRLKLEDPLRQPRLSSGMSVVAEIDTGKSRKLSDLGAWFWGWPARAGSDLSELRTGQSK